MKSMEDASRRMDRKAVALQIESLVRRRRANSVGGSILAQADIAQVTQYQRFRVFK